MCFASASNDLTRPESVFSSRRSCLLTFCFSRWHSIQLANTSLSCVFVVDGTSFKKEESASIDLVWKTLTTSTEFGSWPTLIRFSWVAGSKLILSEHIIKTVLIVDNFVLQPSYTYFLFNVKLKYFFITKLSKINYNLDSKSTNSLHKSEYFFIFKIWLYFTMKKY